MWLKKIRKKKTQSILIILVTLLCSALMTSAFVIMTSWEQPYKELIEECQSEKMRIYLSTNETEVINKISDAFSEMDGVDEIQCVQYLSLGANLQLNGQIIDGFMDLTALQDSSKKHMRMLQGEAKVNEGECLISAVIANNYNAKLGDKVTTESGTEYKVVGIYTNPYNMSFSFDNEIFVSKLESSDELLYYINVYTDEDPQILEDDYREANDGILEGRIKTLDNRVSNNQMTEQIFGAVLLIMSVLIMLVGGIMIQYMIKNTLLTDRESIAIYKTIGYKNRSINAIYMTMYFVLVGIGSVLGACISKFISEAFTKTTFMNLGTESSGGTLKAGVICVAVIIAYVLLQVYLIIRKVKNIRPIEVFRGVKRVKVSRKASKKGFPSFSPLAMARRMITNEKKNTIILVITCVMSVYCVNFGATAINMLSNMSQNNYYWLGFDKHDVSVDINDTEDFPGVVDRLRQEPGVEKIIMNTSSAFCTIPWERGIGDTVVSAMVYDTYEELPYPVLEGRNPRYPNEIALGGYVADKLQKSVGDYVDFYIGGVEKKTMLVCGTFQGLYNMGNSCRILSQTMIDLNIPVKYESASIYLNGTVSVEKFIEAHTDDYASEAKLVNRTEKFASVMDMINGPQMLALRPFIFFVLLLGSLNIIAVIYLRNKDMSKVYSTYKAIGYSSTHLMRANMAYIGTLGMATIIVTVPLFCTFYPMAMQMAFSFFGFKEYPVEYKVEALMAANLASLGIFVICGIISSIGLFKNPIKDLTEE